MSGDSIEVVVVLVYLVVIVVVVVVVVIIVDVVVLLVLDKICFVLFFYLEFYTHEKCNIIKGGIMIENNLL